MNIYLAFRIVSTVSNLILCWIGLRAFKSGVPMYIRLFAMLNIYEQLAEFTILIFSKNPGIQITATNSVVMAELFVYSFTFARIIHSKIVRGLLFFLMSLILVRGVYLLGLHGVDYRLPMGLQTLVYLFLMIPAFTFFREVFIFQREADLVRTFNFWYVAGILFYCSASAIFYLGMGVLQLFFPQNYHNEFFLFSGIVFLVNNCLSIKAFLCLSNSSSR